MRALLPWMIAGGVLLLLLILSWINPTRFYSERQDKEVLVHKFETYCHDMNVNEKDYDGPFQVEVGNTVYACEWKARSRREKYEIIGAWLKSDGESKVYLGPWGM